jgi:hypothetical protein
MIHHLIKQVLNLNDPTTASPGEIWNASMAVLTADPLDLVLYMERVWDLSNSLEPADSNSARDKFWQMSRFTDRPQTAYSDQDPPWDHLAYAYVLESTRIIQILKRIVRAYRSGESLGIPSTETLRWCDATEALLFGAGNPLSAWLSTSTIRPDPETVRRNAYWRMFGLDLSFGTEDENAPAYEKAAAANTGFTALFEELLFELWQAISNERNLVGVNRSDNDRIFRIAEQIRYVLSSRRQSGLLRREELAAVTALGWAELTVSFDSPIVQDLVAKGSSAAERLRIMGERVGMMPHSKSAAFFSMATEISVLLRTIEAGTVANTDLAWVLYALPSSSTTGPRPIGVETRRVITEWAAATGKNLKETSRPVDVRPPRLVAVQ